MSDDNIINKEVPIKFCDITLLQSKWISLLETVDSQNELLKNNNVNYQLDSQRYLPYIQEALNTQIDFMNRDKEKKIRKNSFAASENSYSSK